MHKTITREMRHHFFKGRYIQSLQGIRTLSEKAPKPKANIVFFPGFREHIGLYVAPLLDELVREGYNVFGCDLPNHGFSITNEENRGLITDFNEHLRVGKAMAYYRLWSVPYKDIPTFLMGHSLGALLVLRLLQLKVPLRRRIRGAICLSAALKVDHNISSWARIARPLLETLDQYLEGRSFWDRIPVDHPDPSSMENFKGDRNFYRGPLYLRTAREINRAAIAARKDIHKIDTPLLFVHGDKDTVTPFYEVQNVIRRLPRSNGTLQIVNGCGHHIVGNREEHAGISKQIIKPLVAWLHSNCGT